MSYYRWWREREIDQTLHPSNDFKSQRMKICLAPNLANTDDNGGGGSAKPLQSHPCLWIYLQHSSTILLTSLWIFLNSNTQNLFLWPMGLSYMVLFCMCIFYSKYTYWNRILNYFVRWVIYFEARISRKMLSLKWKCPLKCFC